jgi:hypothetical protein
LRRGIELRVVLEIELNFLLHEFNQRVLVVVGRLEKIAFDCFLDIVVIVQENNVIIDCVDEKIQIAHEREVDSFSGSGFTFDKNILLVSEQCDL